MVEKGFQTWPIGVEVHSHFVTQGKLGVCGLDQRRLRGGTPTDSLLDLQSPHAWHEGVNRPRINIRNFQD